MRAAGDGKPLGDALEDGTVEAIGVAVVAGLAVEAGAAGLVGAEDDAEFIETGAVGVPAFDVSILQTT